MVKFLVYLNRRVYVMLLGRLGKTVPCDCGIFWVCSYIFFVIKGLGQHLHGVWDRSIIIVLLTLLLLNTTCPVLANSVDPDQLASEEAN